MESLAVNKADQAIAITSISDKTITDPSFDVEASVDSGLGLTYDVTGPANISGTMIILTGATGTVTVTVSQAGTANYNSASEQITFEVTDLQSQTITFATLADKTFGDAGFALTATASSGLAVEYTSSDESVATVSSNTVTIVGAGTTTITASQAGDEDYNSASDEDQDLTVGKADQTITITSVADKIITDASFDVDASVDSGFELTYEVSGPANISGTTITLTGTTGTVTVTVSQAGTTNYNLASEQITFKVTDLQNQTISFISLADKTFGDAAFDLTAAASSGLAVTYASSDEAVATISGSTVTILAAGSVDITASQSGDDTFNETMDVTQTLTVNTADQVITFSDLSDVLVGATVNLVATTTSELAVMFDVTGSATLSGNVLTITGVGTVTVTASQAGDDNYNAATDVIRSFEVTEEVVSGIEDEIGFSLYPNPMQSLIKLEGKDLQSLQILTLTGKLLDRVDLLKSREVNLDHLEDGFYIFRISTISGDDIYRRILKTN